MAASAPARRLTERHRQQQTRLAIASTQALHAVWPILDPANIDGTAEQWLRAAVPIVAGQRERSARLSADYVTTFKALETGTARLAIVSGADVATEAVATSLLVTGPYRLRAALARSVPLVTALSNAEATSSSAAIRHVLNGGRETVVETVRSDRDAVGWARATSGRTCAFCAMLASRGAVYREDTVDFEAHDHCGCSAEPIYRDDAALPAGSDRYAELYQQAKAEDGDTLSNFRRLHNEALAAAA